MSIRPLLCLAALGALLHAWPDPVRAAAPEGGPVYGLDQLVAMAREGSPDVAAARWNLHDARAQLRQARAARFLPRLRLEGFGGLVPDARGDVFHPPRDTSGVRPLGPFVRTELEFTQPLYTFGQLSSLRTAAEHGLEVERAALEEIRQGLVLEVKELYWGMLLARDLAALARRLRQELEDRESEVDPDDPDLPLGVPYRLQLALLELRDREAELEDQLRLARSALAWKAGLPEDEPFELAETRLEPVGAEVPLLDELLGRARRERPDWRRLRAGVAARRAQEQAARSAGYPQLFLAGGLRYAVAPGRTDQRNPFVKDEFNLFSGAVVLGLRQSFEIGLIGAEVDRARARRMQLEARERSAAQGIRLEIDQALKEFEGARRELDSARRGRDLTREWLRIARDEYDLDPARIKDLVSAFEGFADAEQTYHEAVYEHNVRLAGLERVVGAALGPGSPE